MHKAPEAFRTISEVSELLDTPPHVLRFWESRFSQVKPVKRAGGRRYYRPADLALLSGIKQLLHNDGMTIRGVQKLLDDKGVRPVLAKADPAHLAANDGDAPAIPLPEAEVPENLALPQTLHDPVQPPLPQTQSKPVTPDSMPDAVPVPSPDPILAPASDPLSAPAPAPTPPESEAIHPMPTPPETDPPTASAIGLSALAARLRRQDPNDLNAHRAALARLRTRLVALHAQRSETLVAGRK
jgi:DNA-binding transcriptional MerR regulator